MAIMSIARWQFQPARVAEGIENAKKVKEIFLANGAESVDWGNVLAGTGPGEWAMFIRYAKSTLWQKLINRQCTRNRNYLRLTSAHLTHFRATQRFDSGA